MLLTACHRRDARLREQILGTWYNDHNEISYLPDGSFHGKFTRVSPDREWTYAGTWDVKNGFLIATLTNSISKNIPNVALGEVDRTEIILMDSRHLAFVYPVSPNPKDGFKTNGIMHFTKPPQWVVVHVHACAFPFYRA